ncbi:MAG: hypothetical protein WA051_00970 [Minisyncoccia bacterium]
MVKSIPSLPTELISSGLHSLFWLFVIIYFTVSAVLIYHWQKYGGKVRRIFIAETVFIVGSVILLLTAFLFIPR